MTDKSYVARRFRTFRQPIKRHDVIDLTDPRWGAGGTWVKGPNVRTVHVVVLPGGGVGGSGGSRTFPISVVHLRDEITHSQRRAIGRSTGGGGGGAGHLGGGGSAVNDLWRNAKTGGAGGVTIKPT